MMLAEVGGRWPSAWGKELELLLRKLDDVPEFEARAAFLAHLPLIHEGDCHSWEEEAPLAFLDSAC